MANFLDRALASMDDPMEFESMLDQLADLAPPPPKSEWQGFLTTVPETPLSAFEGPPPEGFVASEQAKGQEKSALDQLTNSFLGAKEPDRFESQFAPLPGSVSSGARPPGAQVVNPAIEALLQRTGQLSPIDNLADLIMRGR